MRLLNTDRRHRRGPRRSRKRRPTVRYVLAVLSCCGVAASAARISYAGISAYHDGAGSAESHIPPPPVLDEASVVESIEEAKNAVLSLLQRLISAYSSSIDSAAHQSRRRQRRSRRHKRALTFHLDPVDGAQLILATIMVLAAGIMFALTIDSIRIGAKYGFFPVGVKFTRFFPLELGSPLNAPGGIIFPPPGFKEPPEEQGSEENGGMNGSSYSPPDTNGGNYGRPSNDYSPPDTNGKYASPSEAPDDEYGPPDSYSSSSRPSNYGHSTPKSTGYSEPSADYGPPDEPSEEYGPPRREEPSRGYGPSSKGYESSTKGYESRSAEDDGLRSGNYGTSAPSLDNGPPPEEYGPPAAPATTSNGDRDHHSASPSPYYSAPPPAPIVSSRYSSVSYGSVRKPSSSGQDLPSFSASSYGRYADPAAPRPRED